MPPRTLTGGAETAETSVVRSFAVRLVGQVERWEVVEAHARAADAALVMQLGAGSAGKQVAEQNDQHKPAYNSK
jgi:hypothetical protein